MFFYQIDGRVAADIDVKGVALKAGGAPEDTITLAVIRSESCKTFKIACVKKSIADAITNDAICAGYFDQIKSNVFDQDFTNAKMTGFDFQLLPKTEYAIITWATMRLVQLAKWQRLISQLLLFLLRVPLR